MARAGITYLEVTTAIDKIIASGDEPTIQKIRDVLGTGSPNTIHRHLTDWRSARPVEQRKAVELPADLAAALLKEIERQAADARAEVEKQLVAAQAEAAELASTGELLECDLESVREALEAKSEECLKIKADFDRVTDSLARAQHDLETERKVTNEQRDELALTKNRALTLTEQVSDLKAELAAMKQEAKASADTAVAAEKMAAVATAQLEAEKAKNSDLLSRLNAANDAIESIKVDNKSELDVLKSEIKSLRESLESERTTSAEIREKVEKEVVKLCEQIALEHHKNAELQGEIDRLNDKLTAKINKK